MEKGAYSPRNVDRVEIPATPVYSWSVGNYMERFFEGLKEGRFMGTRCPDCGRTSLPPRMVCDNCLKKVDEWVELPPTGRLESFSLAAVEIAENGDLVDLEVPRLIGMVKHEGADTCMVARLEAVGPEDVRVGMKMKAVLDGSPESVLDILSHYVPCD